MNLSATHEQKLAMDLKPISKKMALRIVRNVHQSSDTLPTLTIACLGVYINDNLEGVITLGYGTRPKHTIQKLFPSLTTEDYFEIGRMCINNDFKTNTESQMLSKTVKYIKKHYPQCKVLFTWANGLLGKIGTVYQASNFLYGGYITTECYVQNGVQMHPRGIKKLLHPNDKRRTVRPTAEEKRKFKIDHIRGKQFRYIYFTCGKTQKKKLLKESPFKWTTNYPKLEDCTWKKWISPKHWKPCEKPFIETDNTTIIPQYDNTNTQSTLFDFTNNTTQKPPSKPKGHIGLYNLEPKIVNSAMMQVSKYYKKKGYQVWDWHPLYKYDKVYAFSLFDFTDKQFVTEEMITGGTGFDIESKLPPEIEEMDYDYTIFPQCDYSIVWFSRGCFRNCPFCIVRQKEGYIHPVDPKQLNPRGKYIKVMDNNFFANPQWRNAIKQLQKWNKPVDMQGFDIRLFDDEQGEALTSLRHYKQFKFAWDNPRENIDDKIELLLDYIKPSKLMCYVLIGYWSTPEEDLHRVMHLWDDYHIDAFAMPYKRYDTYQSRFSRWCNNKLIFKTRSWGEYLSKCK